MLISVIIPALNEADLIEKTIGGAGAGAEVIVADGGSTDGTAELAERAGAQVVRTAPGRGLQMDRAALKATGEVLLFLHADTTLPSNWMDAISRAVDEDRAVAGAFRLKVASPERWFRVVEFVAGLRARFLKHIYGDQAIFARREVFFNVGGFRGLPFMEDVDCVRRLQRAGRFVLLKESISTSPRRWVSGGKLKNTLKNWLFLIFYRAGVSPERLYTWYYR